MNDKDNRSGDELTGGQVLTICTGVFLLFCSGLWAMFDALSRM